MITRSRPSLDLTAHCACAAVSLRLTGTVRAMLLCSCLDCQKASGTGHTSAAMVRLSDVALDGAVTRFTRPADSGATLTRSFCPTCGTPIMAVSSRAPDMALLPVGLFGADAGWFVPNQLIFARSHHDWDIIAADLPRHDAYRKEGNAP